MYADGRMHIQFVLYCTVLQTLKVTARRSCRMYADGRMFIQFELYCTPDIEG
jgi:hypothetical protein